MKNIDYTMYYVTDEDLLSSNHTLETSVQDAILGGCTMIQLREKHSSTLDFYNKAVKIKAICDKYNIPLIINDRIDVALAINADGVHLGQDDMPLDIARKIMGDGKIIGISTSTLDEALIAQQGGADYVGVGAMYSTNTKTDANLTTIDELTKIKNNLKIPVVAIGGINLDTIPALKPAQIDGVAIVSAISMQEDTVSATRKLKNTFLKQYQTKGVIFDIDGTLLETMNIWDNVLLNLMNTLNIRYTEDEIQKIWNMGFAELAQFSIKKFKLDMSVKEFWQLIKKLSVEEYKNSKIHLKKGAKKLLEYLKEKGVKLAIATALCKEQYEIVLTKTGIIDYFDIIASSVDLKMEKSDRQIFDYIAKNLQVPNKNFIFFEDDINSSTGAKRAGVKLCIVSNKKYNGNSKFDALIDYKIDDFENKLIYDEIIVEKN
ncbi:thiamine-phosphate pyrophosphorylase [Peptoanaerobacter stomatis]|uniref:Thiamine-phosphate synthase n=1 Tax=Peptoanaerobacter stomatis TaxID=796937 RepID=V9HQ44_9FIRM|nr:thiamine phosphate synthase [Peptoanaerobacter stomatis]EHL17501.1 thiamine-phosphate pyrophosphorylase [Peptoanaerobacter stomatis]